MNSKKTDVLLIFFGAIILCFIGFVNQYPLTYPDTGTYLRSGFTGIIPMDRPIFYGLFIRHISLWTSLWLVILLQGILTSYMLLNTIGIFFNGIKKTYVFVFSVVFLTVFTGVSYNVSILIPDIFSSIAILCLINLLLNNTLGKIKLVFISILFVFCLAAHNSNFLSTFLVFLCIAVYALIKKIKKKQSICIKRSRIVTCFVLFMSYFLIVPGVNYTFNKKFSFSQASHIFLLNHFVETGILKDYLHEEGAHKNYKIYLYKDSLDLVDVYFMWSYNRSPLYRIWGGNAWTDSKPEFDSINEDILTTPKYLSMFMRNSIESTFQQYFHFDIPNNGGQGKGSASYIEIHKYFNSDERNYLNSTQNQYGLDAGLTNLFQRIIIMASLALLVCFLLVPSMFSKSESTLKWFVSIIMSYSFSNALVCSSFSTVDNRYQDRIVWLLPFVAIILCIRLISDHLLKRKKSE